MKKRPKKPKNAKNKLWPTPLPRGEVSPTLQPRHTTRHCEPRIGTKQSTPGLPLPPRLRALPLKTQPPKCLPRLDRGPPFPSAKKECSCLRHREPRIGVKRSIFTSALALPAPHAHMASAFGRRMFALRSGSRRRFTHVST